MKLSVPLSTIVSTCLADMINLLLGLGCRAHLAPAPMPVGETGVARARAVGAEGDRPACTSGLRLWKSFRLCCPRGRSGRPPRPVPDLPGLHPCPREGGAISNPNKKGRLCRSEAEASRQSRDRLKRHPQEGQHSAASWRDPGPSASGERHSIARGIEAEGRDALRLGSRKPGAVHRTRRLQLSAHERKQSPELELEAKRGALQHSQKKKATAENDNA
jgi:hypothetical protein